MTIDRDITLTVEGETRSTLVHVPLHRGGGVEWPLVVVFHGRGIDAQTMVRLSGMTEIADREGFIVAYPEGRPDPKGGKYWKVSYTPDAVVTDCDELGFVSDLVSALINDYQVDAQRVYAVGFSNGGILCYALARWMTERFAAIGAVGGIADFGCFTLSEPISLIHVHGTKDRFIPYLGGKTARKDMPIVFPAVMDMLRPWLEATGCGNLQRVETLIDPNDPALVTRVEAYGPGWSGSEVKIVTVDGGGHTWPGRLPVASYFGKWTTAFSAGSMIWDFISPHHR